MRRGAKGGFTLVECMVAVSVAALIFLGTLSLLGFARMQNELEQQRARAHQIVSQKLEIERCKLFTWTASQSQQTIWDNGTPSDTSDDTVGTLEIVVTDPATGTVLMTSPNPATLVQIEATLTWRPRSGTASGRTFRETVMTYKVP